GSCDPCRRRRAGNPWQVARRSAKRRLGARICHDSWLLRPSGFQLGGERRAGDFTRLAERCVDGGRSTAALSPVVRADYGTAAGPTVGGRLAASARRGGYSRGVVRPYSFRVGGDGSYWNPGGPAFPPVAQTAQVASRPNYGDARPARFA